MLRLFNLLSMTTESTFRTMPKPKMYWICDDYTFGRNRMSTESAHFPTFGAETKTETEIRSTFKVDDFQNLASSSLSRDGNHTGSTGPTEPLLRTTATTNMAATNFIVITNGEVCALTGTANIDQ